MRGNKMISLKNIFSASGAILIMALSSSVNAAIINHNTFTTDTESGLDWYDTSYTLNMSYDTVSSLFSSTLSGWHYATRIEVNNLVSNATGMTVLNNTRNDVSNATAFTSLLESLGYSWTDDKTLFAITADVVANGHNYVTLRNNTVFKDYLNNDNNVVTDDAVNPRKASLLVRNSSPVANPNPVPIPAALFMFLPGILGIYGYTHYRKK